MWRGFIFSILFFHTALSQTSSKWQTLSGSAPIIIARGGYSGLFPESSNLAFESSVSFSLPGVTVFCDLQLTKDSNGICLTGLRLDNTTNIATIYPKGANSYTVNGQPLHGWFAIDFLSRQLLINVTLVQSIYSRPSVFDNTFPISTLQDVGGIRAPHLWVNVQYDSFYNQNKLSAATYIQTATKSMTIDYISSPEVSFLQSLGGKVSPKTQLVFRFLESDDIEPTTKSTYASMVAKLSFIKTFASGILVPKDYIWPVGKNGYLQPATTLVNDAHKLGLQVYAATFANDAPASYNYSYDPITEYLQFIDNSQFSVDGVLTDFPSTASEAIGCMVANSTSPTKGTPLIITHNGASGVYPGSTDLAYQRAVDDGANIIDCSVQMTKDNVPVCLSSVNLMSGTTAIKSFMARSSKVPEIQDDNGIFSFDLTWDEIKSLLPEMTSPFATQTGLQRNPAYKNQGKFMSLADFLAFAKEKPVSGVLINVQHAFYLAGKGFSITDAVLNALKIAGYDKQTTQKVFIQSDDSSVFSKFEGLSYSRVYQIDEVISSASPTSIGSIKKFADAVTVTRSSTMASSNFFVTQFTDVVDKMHKSNISVYVSVLKNEFVSLAFDFYSDPTIEIATFVQGMKVDGLVTEFPATASKYLRSACYQPNKDTTYTILSIQPGSLLSAADSEVLPPAEAPAPVLSVSDVVEPPLPAAATVQNQSQGLAPTESTHGSFAGISLMPSMLWIKLWCAALILFMSNKTML